MRSYKERNAVRTGVIGTLGRARVALDRGDQETALDLVEDPADVQPHDPQRDDDEAAQQHEQHEADDLRRRGEARRVHRRAIEVLARRAEIHP